MFTDSFIFVTYCTYFSLPIMTEGMQINLTLHTRPITHAQYNYDGDLVFASSLDSIVSVWNTDGEIKGTFDGHQGAVTCMEQTEESLLTGSSDRSIILWDIYTGKQKLMMPFKSTVKSVNISDNNIMVFCDDSYNNKPKLIHYDIRTNMLVQNIDLSYIVTTSVVSGDFCIFGDFEGNLRKLDMRKTDIVKTNRIHSTKINEIKKSPCSKYFISSSNDTTSKIFTSELEEIKVFQSSEPVNSASVFPENNILVTVGGISARDVTLTKGKTKFDVNFYDIIKEERVGFYSTHFGTINTIDVSRTGKSFVSGGEDGIIIMINMGDDFYSASFTQIS